MILTLNCSHGLDPSYNKADYLLRAAERLGYDFVQMYNPHHPPTHVLNIEPYQQFVKGSVWTGVWEIDVLCDRAAMNASDWVASDTIFIAVSTLPKRLVGLGDPILLLQACDPLLHRRIESIPQSFDFVLAGSMGINIYQERERVYALMREHFSFESFGKGHAPTQYVAYLNQARVQFIRSMNTTIADSELAQRFFECLAIGPVLTNYAVDLQATGLVDGEDLLVYHNDEEMIALMHRLLDDPIYAQELALNGRAKALKYHTYEHRLTTILEASGVTR